MGAAEPIPDQAIVVRGGQVPFQKSLREVCEVHEETGHYGFSVQSAAGRTLEELARELPHRQVGHTTVGVIRKLGYDVICTPGRGFHATVVVPQNWLDAAANQLASLFQGARNQSPRKPR